MSNDSLIEIIDTISAGFLLSDPESDADIKELIIHLQTLGDAVSGLKYHDIFTLTSTAIDLLQEINHETPENHLQLMDTLRDLISEIQNIHRKESAEVNTSSEMNNSGQEVIGLRHPGKLPDHLDNEVFAEFLSIQPDMLHRMETLILELEETYSQKKLTELKRLIHTAKGEAGFLNLGDVENLLHHTEDFIENESAAEKTDTLLSIVDWLKKTYQTYSGGPDIYTPVQEILETLKPKNPARPVPDTAKSLSFDSKSIEEELLDKIGPPNTPEISNNGLFEKFTLTVRKHIDQLNSLLLTLSTDPDDAETATGIHRIFAGIHELALFFNIKDMAVLAKETGCLAEQLNTPEHVPFRSWLNVIFESIEGLSAILNNISINLPDQTSHFPISDLAQYIFRIRAALSGQITTFPTSVPPRSDKKIGDILVSSGLTDPKTIAQYATVQAQMRSDKKIGEMLVLNGKVQAKDVSEALQSQTPIQDQRSSLLKDSISVDADRLDRMVNMIGELVIVESMFSQSEEIQQINSPQLCRHITAMDKITRELQETGLSLRMMPVRPIFQKMGRVARDVAKKANKKIKFVMCGEETELDKTIVDKLNDPLMHMIRNAIDHGIEDALTERTDQGKPEIATITLRAFHKGGNIFIEVEDDGMGMSPEKILNKAISLNLVSKSDQLNEQDIFHLIFEPGFTTAKKITDISGRGVGMNVVRESIESLRGTIDIQSTVGKGSRFSITIPLTLAIIDGMIVRAADIRYIVPTLSIVMSTCIEKKDIQSVMNQGEMIMLQDGLIPLFRLNMLVDHQAEQTGNKRSFAVIVENNNRKIALGVDELIGKQQIVIKSLGEFMKSATGISGGAILQDGRVGLILDVPGLIRIAHQKP
ncbi:MAG: chemotaxis protein CheA [Proteobacteria bacterium]|nr:chemotaxis protein CheA [Pseudomonadota bacterium]